MPPSGTCNDTPRSTRITRSYMTSISSTLSSAWRSAFGEAAVESSLMAPYSAEQSRGVMSFSSAYLAAAASIMGRTTSRMGVIQSLTMAHFEPSHC